MIPEGRVLSTLVEKGYDLATPDMTAPEREEYLQRNLLGESLSFHLPPEDDPRPASLQFQNVGTVDGLERVYVNLEYDGPSLQVPLSRFAEDMEFIYYETVERQHQPQRVNYLTGFPSVEQIGPGDLSLIYVLRAGTLPRLRASMHLMAHALVFYHDSRHQTAQQMYETHREEYSSGEYEIPDQRPMEAEVDEPAESAVQRLATAVQREKYVKRYFEFCEDEPYSDSGPKTRREVYRERIQATP